MCSGFEAGAYSRPIDCVYHSTLGLRVIQKKKRRMVQTIRNIAETSGEDDQEESCRAGGEQLK